MPCLHASEDLSFLSSPVQGVLIAQTAAFTTAHAAIAKHAPQLLAHAAGHEERARRMSCSPRLMHLQGRCTHLFLSRPCHFYYATLSVRHHSICLCVFLADIHALRTL